MYICTSFVVTFVATYYKVMDITKFWMLAEIKLEKVKNRIK